jgi:hypothetical protein
LIGANREDTDGAEQQFLKGNADRERYLRSAPPCE